MKSDTTKDQAKQNSALLDKADALMHRHRPYVAGATKNPVEGIKPDFFAPDAAAADELKAIDLSEDLPILTEAVDPYLASLGQSTPASLLLGERLREALAPLPPDISRAVESWLAAILPRLVARQLDGVADRVASEVGDAMRESLPLLIADLVRHAADNKANSRKSRKKT